MGALLSFLWALPLDGCQPATGGPAVTSAPCSDVSASAEQNARVLRRLHDERQIVEAVSDILAAGDPHLQAAAAAQVILVATRIGQSAWRDAHREKLAIANKISTVNATPAQFEAQLDQYQEMELQRVYRLLGALGGEAAMDYAFEEASDTAQSTRRRALALKLAEDLARAGARRHADQIPALADELRQKEP
jgi:hypothetical protein